MKKLFTPLLLLFVFTLSAQDFINGDFETNTATGDVINPSAAVFNDLMSNCNSYGTQPNLDILTAGTYGAAQSGDWFVAMTGSQTDRLNMELSAPLVTGNSYTISFFDRAESGFTPDTIKIGLSTSNNDIGDLLFTVTELAGADWAERTFTFVAPNNGQFISVYGGLFGTVSNWVLIDNFSLSGTNSTLSLLRDDDLKLVQNPVSGYLKLQANEPLSEVTVSIVSTMGNIIFQQDYDSIDRLEINVSALSAGFYVVHLQTKDQRYKSLKFIKN